MLSKKMFFLLLLLPCFLLGHVSAQTVKTDQWLVKMSKLFPNAMCQPQSPFMKCYDVTEDQCIEEMTLATSECIEQFRDKIPETFNKREEAVHWGQILGQCVGTKYELKLADPGEEYTKCMQSNLPQ